MSRYSCEPYTISEDYSQSVRNEVNALASAQCRCSPAEIAEFLGMPERDVRMVIKEGV